MLPAFAHLQEELARMESASGDSVPPLVDALLKAAWESGASDLHLEPKPARLALRLRLDGCLADAAEIRGPLRGNILQRVKVLAGLMTYRTDIPQEGRIARTPSAQSAGDTDMRVSIYPTIHGERAVIRFFHSRLAAAETGQPAALDLASLGLAPDDLARLTGLLDHPQGLILLTGPAGSGKTTTLYACLQHLLRRWENRRHIVTIEDPVERAVEGLTQTQVNSVAELDFSAALRALLRQDPEVLMVGEIRDAETARIAVQAALTGHLLLSTIHASSASEVLVRLVELGVEPYLASSVISGVLAQRLVRVLCENCRVATHAAAEPFRQSPEGCASCRNTGYHGRMLLGELLVPDDAIRQGLRERASGQKLAALAAESGCTGLWQRGLAAVAVGRTTREELRRVLVERT